MHKKSIFLFLFLSLLVLDEIAAAQSPIRARTDSGNEVVLYPDGTWKYSVEPEAKPGSNRHSKPTSARKAFKTRRGSFTVWYDDTKWKLSPEKPGEDPFFELMGEDAYVVIIAEGLEIPTLSLKKVALENAQSEATNVKVLMEEKRLVNGTEVLCMKFSLTREQIPFTFYGYYFGGKQGAIQVVTYTGQNLFDKYQREMTDFLNGLEIH